MKITKSIILILIFCTSLTSGQTAWGKKLPQPLKTGLNLKFLPEKSLAYRLPFFHNNEPIPKPAALFAPVKVLINDGQKKWTYTYDLRGNMISECESRNDNDTGCQSERSWVFDSAGLRHGEQFRDEGEGENHERIKFFYDKPGRINSYIIEEMSYEGWRNFMRVSYSFKETGLRQTWLREKWQEGTWVNDMHAEYRYGSAGKLSEINADIWEGEKWMQLGRYFFDYDTAGNLVSEIWWEKWEFGEWSGTDRILSTYDGKGNLLTETFEWGASGEWHNGEKYSYFYDTLFNLTGIAGEVWEKEKWVPLCRTEFAYDSNWNVIKTEFSSLYDDKWMPDEGYLEIIYNSKKNRLFYTGRNCSVEYSGIGK